MMLYRVIDWKVVRINVPAFGPQTAEVVDGLGRRAVIDRNPNIFIGHTVVSFEPFEAEIAETKEIEA